MTLATVDADCRPSTRIVLLKGYDADGLVWFTNYLSRKGRQLAGNPAAALQFHWVEMERVVRIEGSVRRCPMRSRTSTTSRGHWPRASAPGRPSRAASSAGRSVLVARAAEYGLKFGLHPPRPPHWGGYRLAPRALGILAGPAVAAA